MLHLSPDPDDTTVNPDYTSLTYAIAWTDKHNGMIWLQGRGVTLRMEKVDRLQLRLTFPEMEMPGRPTIPENTEIWVRETLPPVLKRTLVRDSSLELYEHLL